LKVVGENCLERVVSNLVENAFRHSPPDSTTINLEDDGEFILLSVDDEGSGVPQDISKTYFKKFSKGRINLAELALGFILPYYS